MTQTPDRITGGCLCGDVRFEFTGEIDFPHVCSCPHCQKRSGAPMQTWIDVPMDSFAWTGPGEVTWYETFPSTKRGHCARCGSNLAACDEGGAMMGLTITALDDPSIVVPTHHSFKDNAVSWLPLVPWDGAPTKDIEQAVAAR